MTNNSFYDFIKNKNKKAEKTYIELELVEEVEIHINPVKKDIEDVRHIIIDII